MRFRTCSCTVFISSEGKYNFTHIIPEPYHPRVVSTVTEKTGPDFHSPYVTRHYGFIYLYGVKKKLIHRNEHK